ncbi:MAG: hypothetical protein MUP44_08215 [Anaerolineales bacterium]|nr:hypothetical protein [Anaerolineales bacterium]
MISNHTPNVWQISGGPVDRPYAEIFLKHSVALIGPGEDGPWRPGRREGDGLSFLRRFAENIKVGDLLLLRTAINTVSSVGLVAGEYEYLEPFDDVNGWDLRHGHRVRWYRLPDPYCFESSVFGANPMRFSRVQSTDAVEYARSFLASGLTHWQESPLLDLPPFVATTHLVPRT